MRIAYTIMHGPVYHLPRDKDRTLCGLAYFGTVDSDDEDEMQRRNLVRLCANCARRRGNYALVSKGHLL